ncbi:outer membrane protein OmpK [Bdellovibrio sp. HCB274]|uniref:nucleoside-specific channel-forming Tsx family protein n=1 Tax=Bdellovibrio sp. HCB274 TaxID=3394361 RepID=UPI0039B393A0
MFQKVFSTLLIVLALSPAAFAAKATDGDIHKGDYKWFQFNIMQSIDNKIPFENQQDTYFEMEFGGRSGILDLYGYIDIFDVFNSPNSDRHGDTSLSATQDDNFFFKFAPRFSLDYMTGHDLNAGPVQEWYIATLFNVGDRALFEEYIGLGTDIQIPWLGKLGANLMARHVRENYGADDEGEWNGYILTTNWFKPFVEFENKSFITWQGYLDYKFGANKIADDVDRTSWSLEWFNGIYWHSKQYAVGYGLKYYQNMALFKSGGFAGETSGFGHYLAVTYKF